MSINLEYSNWCPSYADLPMEIILHIFRYLGWSDLQAAGVTCTRWHEALFEPEFNNKTLVRFAKVPLCDQHPPAKDFIQCERRFRHFCLEDVTFGQVQQMMSHIGSMAQSITFDSVDLSNKQFYSIMRLLKQLQSLTVTSCSPLFMSGGFLDIPQNEELIKSFVAIKELSLRDNQYLTDAILLRLTALMRSIESLDLSGCHIAFHNAIHRRFYPTESNTINVPSESVLTFKCILHLLTLQRANLRELNFSRTLIGSASLVALSNLECGGLQLQRLRLAACRQLNVVGIKTFLATQPQLVLLDLTDCICVNDDCLETIVRSNPMLEQLNLYACEAITNTGAMLLGNMRNLQSLNISCCDGISTEGITKGIARERNTKLRALDMSFLKVCEECIKTVARNLIELRSLKVSHCVNAVTDDSVQCIIQNLRWLQVLSLENCAQLTDAALTGVNISKLELKNANTSTLENFYPPYTSSLAERDSSTNSMKISLRSKAEDEIVRDAKCKQAMFAAYEMNLIDENDFEGFNIQSLRGLRSLTLNGCNRITDVSLKYGLKFIELRQLHLSNCQQISLVGMEAIVQNCPSIEELDLSDCYKINDKTIQAVTSNLTRLRSLNISGCSQLTDHSLDAILVNCKCLHTLSVYRCRRMYTDIEDRLSVLTTLRNLHMDNIGNIDNAEFFRLKKRYDY